MDDIKQTFEKGTDNVIRWFLGPDPTIVESTANNPDGSAGTENLKVGVESPTIVENSGTPTVVPTITVVQIDSAIPKPYILIPTTQTVPTTTQTVPITTQTV